MQNLVFHISSQNVRFILLALFSDFLYASGGLSSNPHEVRFDLKFESRYCEFILKFRVQLLRICFDLKFESTCNVLCSEPSSNPHEVRFQVSRPEFESSYCEFVLTTS
jgi:hypothetical protein